ncbi:Gfo/Idh/MocA family protein [Natrialbaceae archaeon GCM10025810]|uniref:Gfo/Idh/MocA family protein n=1 Tax=Halovalidus salilacus TaxID=3075124 RepID=UPI0036104A0E
MGIRTAVVGGGTVSRAHLAGAQKNPRTELIAVCDLDEDRARERAREFGTMAVVDYTELLDDVDYIHVCTPVQTHFEIAKTAIEAGVGVVIEKPSTVTSEEIERLDELAAENDVPATVIHNHLFFPTVRKVREMIAAGELGRITSVDVVYAGLTPPDMVNRGSWVFDLPGGEFEEGLPHPIYTALGVGGWPASEDDISAQTVRSRDYDDDFAYDQAQVQYVSESGTLCHVTMLCDTLPQRLQIINGSEQSIVLDEINQSIFRLDEDYTRSTLARSMKGFDVSLSQVTSTIDNARSVATSAVDDSWETAAETNSHFAIFDRFVDAVESGADVPVPLEQSKWTIKIMEEIRESAVGDRVVSAASDEVDDADGDESVPVNV